MSLGRYKESGADADDEDIRQTSNFDTLIRVSNQMATDGSGGPQYVPAELKRMGSAVALLQFSEQDDSRPKVKSAALQMSRVPGRQTVPRSELYALVNARRSARSPLENEKNIWSDKDIDQLEDDHKASLKPNNVPEPPQNVTNE